MPSICASTDPWKERIHRSTNGRPKSLFQDLQADTICWDCFLRGQTCGGDTGLLQLWHPRSHEPGKVWEGLGKEQLGRFKERAACTGSQSADSLGCSLGACLLAMLCLAFPSLHCPACLPAFRHSVNLLLLSCCLLAGACTATRLQAMSTVLAPFSPNSVGTAGAPFLTRR